jgi:hypothetical protein
MLEFKTADFEVEMQIRARPARDPGANLRQGRGSCGAAEEGDAAALRCNLIGGYWAMGCWVGAHLRNVVIFQTSMDRTSSLFSISTSKRARAMHVSN